MFLVDFIKKLFKPLLEKLRGLKTLPGVDSQHLHAALNVLAVAAHYAQMALPLIELIVLATPTTLDDTILTAVKSLGITVEQLFDNSNDILHDGTRQRVAAEALKQHLIELVKAHGKVDFE